MFRETLHAIHPYMIEASEGDLRDSRSDGHVRG
jgi:hypothetical protein